MNRRPAFRITSSLPWGLFGLIVALHVSGLVLTLRAGQGWRDIGFLPVTVGFAGVGALVAARTSNRVGWLFLAAGLVLALTIGAKDYAEGAGAASLPGAPWAGWILTLALSATFAPILLALLLFPDGRVPSARWRLVAWAAVVSAVVGMVCSAVADVNFSSNFPHLSDPVTIVPAASLKGVYNGFLAFQPFIFLACAASLVVRLLRSRGEQRQQLKWFVYAAALAATAVAIGSFGPDPSVEFAVFAPLIPIGAGVAILKYRLYDIDVVINKTVVFGALAAFITAVYVAIVVGIGAAIGQGSKPNLGLSILATAVVAVAFQPVRERVQRFANRLVYGRRATPYEVLSEFSSRMAGAYESEDLLPRMARILGEGTGAGSTRVWLMVGDELRAETTWPTELEAPDPLVLDDGELPEIPGTSLALPVHHRGELLGALTLSKQSGERLTPAEHKLASDLASQAGLVLRNVRLTEELLHRLKELQASRQRIVAAQDQERRRLERNIHDGAQQQLVALAVKVRLARQLGARDPGKANDLLEKSEQEVSQALEDLRDLARGIYPPLLADQGLVAALEGQGRRSAVRVQVEADGIGRYPMDAEAAVYFCCLEALQNVAKYASATCATIRLRSTDGVLAFEVSDDGTGFDTSKVPSGTGLQGMADRLAVLGGELHVDSAPGRGTRITGHLRLAASNEGPAPVGA